jgi:hypothetical protein
MLPYVLETVPAVERILERAYGRRLLDPNPADCRPLWEARTAEEWRSVAADLHVSEVLTFPDWHLDLREVARSERYALYRAAATPAMAHPIGLDSPRR